MKLSNYIPISRDLFNHQLWLEDRVYSKFEAWLDLIQMARFEDTKKYIGNNVIEIKRGQIHATYRFLANRCGWSTKKVGGYFELLITEKMVKKETEEKTGQTLITICNYDKYNAKINSEETDEETARKQQGNEKETRRKREGNEKETKSNKDNIENNEKNEKESKEDILSAGAKKKLEGSDSIFDSEKKEKGSAQKEKKFDRSTFIEILIREGADPKHVDDWIKVRIAKRAVFTETALNKFLKECYINNFPVAAAVKICAEKSWQGFEYKWLIKDDYGKSTSKGINSRDERAREIEDLEQFADNILKAGSAIRNGCEIIEHSNDIIPIQEF